MAAHRYWRVNVTSSISGSFPYVIAEIEFRSTLGGADITGGGTAISDANQGAPQNATSPALAFDNNNGTDWSSGFAFSGSFYVGYDFGVAVDIVDVAISASATNTNGAPKNFTIDYSDNGSSWTPLITVSNEPAWSANEQRTFTNITNQAPAFTSPPTFSVNENQNTAATVVASDPDLDTITYSIAGGADAALFAIGSSSGQITFITTPDFENPHDSDANNTYEITVRADDGQGNTADQLIQINVVDVFPVFTNNGGGTSVSFSINENTTTATTVTTQAGTETFSIVGGTDASAFSVDSISGELTFNSAPDYEAPHDSDTDNVYSVIVEASDGIETAQQTLTITINDVASGVGNEPFYADLWQAVVNVDGVDVSGRVVGNIRIEAEESTSRIASFSIRPVAGAVSAGAWLGKAVTIDYQKLNSVGGVLSTHRLFTGITDDATFDSASSLLEFDCTDNLQGAMELLDKSGVEALLPNAYPSEPVLGTFKDGWLWLESLLKTTPETYDFNVNGIGVVTEFAANPVDDYTFTAGGIIHGTVNHEVAKRRTLVNKLEIEYKYRFTRLRHREHFFYWNRSFCQYFAQSHTLPTRQMVEQSATGAGWNVRMPITYTGLPASHSNACYSGGNWVNPEGATSELVLGANWKSVKRWTQDALEIYNITVSAAQSIAWVGEIGFAEQYSNETETDAKEWLDGTETPTGGTWYQDTIGDIVDDRHDRTNGSNPDFLCVVAKARTEILQSHRQNFVWFDVPIEPDLDRIHTASMSAQGITAKGKVYQLAHNIDTSTGRAVTSIRLAVSVSGGAAGSGDTPIGLMPEPDTSASVSQPTSTTLPTRIGNDDTVEPFDEGFDGFTGNYTLAVGSPSADQIYPRRFKVTTPNINQTSIDERQAATAKTYNVDIPDDNFTITVT